MSVHKPSLLDRLLYPHVRRCIETYEQAHDWTRRRCPECHSPVAFDGAEFCAFCGVKLTAQIEPPQPVVPMIDDVERHTSGIHKVVLEQAIADARAKAHEMQPPTTLTGRFKAYKAQGERPMNAWQKAKKESKS